MNFMIYWWGIKYLNKIFLCFMVNANIPYDACIAFKLHNFVEVTFYHQCEELCNIFIYLNQYVGHIILNME